MKKKFLLIPVFLLVLIIKVCAQNENISPKEAEAIRTEFVNYSKKFVGAEYVLGGTGPVTFDCSGFVYSMSRESIGIQLPRTTKAMYSFCKKIEDDEREAGDLIFFKTTNSGEVSHVAIYMGNSQFIHCASDGPNTGVIVSSLKENYWKNHYYSSGRFLTASKSEVLAATDKNSKVTSKTTVSKSKSSATAAKSSSATASTAKKTSSNSPYASSKTSRSSGSFWDKVVLDGSLSVDWNLFTPDNFILTWRGLDTMVHACYNGEKFKPGFGTYFRYDAGTENFQIPIVASLTFSEFVRVFAGPVIPAGKATLPGNSDEKIKNSVFPGILGICWNTPSLKAGKTLISFSQDIHYTVFNGNDGAALNPMKSLTSGIVFSSGVRVTLPLCNL